MKPACDVIRRGVVVAVLAAAFLRGAARPECTISGRVTDQRGAPITSAIVTATAKPTGRSDPYQNGSALTSKNGEFCLAALRPAEYVVRAVAGNAAPSASPACTDCCIANYVFVSMPFAGAQNGSGLRAVHVQKNGNVAGVVVILRRTRVYCVPGEVRDRSGALLGNVALRLEADGWSASVINEGGRFLLTNLPVGKYRLAVTEPGQFGRVLTGEIIDVGPGRDPVVVRLP